MDRHLKNAVKYHEITTLRIYAFRNNKKSMLPNITHAYCKEFRILLINYFKESKAQNNSSINKYKNNEVKER